MGLTAQLAGFRAIVLLVCYDPDTVLPGTPPKRTILKPLGYPYDLTWNKIVTMLLPFCYPPEGYKDQAGNLPGV